MTFYKRNLFHEKYERSEFDYLLCINYNRLKIHIGGKYSVKIQSYDLFVIKRPTIVLATSYGAPPQFKSHLLLKLTDERGFLDGVRALRSPNLPGKLFHKLN